MDTIRFKLEINKLRRTNKNKWYEWAGIVNNKAVVIKAYDTWLQIFRVNGIQQNTLMDISVTEFNHALENGVH